MQHLVGIGRRHPLTHTMVGEHPSVSTPPTGDRAYPQSPPPPSPPCASATMTTRRRINAAGLSAEQLDVIERFEADYNAIDHHLRRELGIDKNASFSQLVREYGRRHAGWRDGELLMVVAEVRNAIVHGKTEPYRYVAVPAPAIMENLNRSRERLTHPARVIPTFQRAVRTVSVDDSLASVLRLVHEFQFSQFPVYDDARFRGLLTENGVVRWMAKHVTVTLSLVELDEVRAIDVLKNEERRKSFNFVSRDCRVDDVCALFATNEWLEAVLVTANGRDSEGLIGIATRADIIGAT